MNNYDPWNGSSLKDPQYKNLTEQERNVKLREIQTQRIERAIHRFREPVKSAVAYYFHQKQWLSKSFIDKLNESRYGLPQDIFETDDDMGELSNNEATPNGTHPNQQ